MLNEFRMFYSRCLLCCLRFDTRKHFTIQSLRKQSAHTHNTRFVHNFDLPAILFAFPPSFMLVHSIQSFWRDDFSMLLFVLAFSISQCKNELMTVVASVATRSSSSSASFFGGNRFSCQNNDDNQTATTMAPTYIALDNA